MKVLREPTRADFRALADIAAGVDQAGDWPASHIEKAELGRGLLSFRTQENMQATFGPWPEGLAKHWRRVEGLSAYKWLKTQPNFAALLQAFERKAKKGGTYVDRRAPAWLLDACGFALATSKGSVVTGIGRSQVGIETKRRALDAVEVLVRCEKEGLRISELSGASNLRGDLLAILRKEIKRSIQNHSRPYRGPHSVRREAVEVFAIIFSVRFNCSPPPVIVKHFAALIGYESERLSDHIKDLGLGPRS